eukprot:scaffold2961_cov118-Isochrysis_galbana.AAC.5
MCLLVVLLACSIHPPVRQESARRVPEDRGTRGARSVRRQTHAKRRAAHRLAVLSPHLFARLQRRTRECLAQGRPGLHRHAALQVVLHNLGRATQPVVIAAEADAIRQLVEGWNRALHPENLRHGRNAQPCANQACTNGRCARAQINIARLLKQLDGPHAATSAMYGTPGGHERDFPPLNSRHPRVSGRPLNSNRRRQPWTPGKEAAVSAPVSAGRAAVPASAFGLTHRVELPRVVVADRDGARQLGGLHLLESRPLALDGCVVWARVVELHTWGAWGGGWVGCYERAIGATEIDAGSNSSPAEMGVRIPNTCGARPIVDVAGREGLHVLLAAAGRFLLGSLVALGAIREYRSADEELVAWDAGILDRTCEATLVAREH